MDVKLHAFPLSTGGKKSDFCRQVCDLQIILHVSSCACDKTKPCTEQKNLVNRSEVKKIMCLCALIMAINILCFCVL